MEKIARFFFSMRMMALGMVIFLAAIATATFLESKYDVQTAKIIVYNAKWFEILLGYLCVNLIANIFTYRMYKREKIAVLMFHLSFIVMIIGAGMTRYISFEGIMPIREQATSNTMFSSDPYFWFVLADGETQTVPYSTKAWMSEQTNNFFEVEVPDFPGHATPVRIEYANFRKNLVDSLVVNDSIQGTALEIVTDGMTSKYLTNGNFLMLGDIALSFDKSDAMPGIEIVKNGAKYQIKSQLPIRYLPMSEMQKAARSGAVSDSLYKSIPVDTLVPFQMATLYQVGDQQFVFKSAQNHAKNMLVKSSVADAGSDYLTVKITDGDLVEYVDLKGGFGIIPGQHMLNLNGLIYRMAYGSKRIELPFSITCDDFQLDKYPGSNQPSSFASNVTVTDELNQHTHSQRIFMNNVMDYEGYRFFQSSYDQDEGGTILSVNHDWWGTNVSYLGYLMMGIAMIFSLFTPDGRFRELNRLLKKSKEKREKLLSVFIGVLLLSTTSFAQDHDHDHDHDHNHNTGTVQNTTTEALLKDPVHRVMSEEHSDELAAMLVQDNQGRIIPFHTLSDQLLRKLSRSNTYEGYNAVQTVMSMHMYPDYWATQDVLYVSGKSNLREKVGAEDGLASFADLTDPMTGQFLLMEDYSNAHQKLESKRGEYDKRLLQLGERYQVLQMIFSWTYMRILPVKGEPNNTWYIPLSSEIMKIDSVSSTLALQYLSSLDKAATENKYGEASDLLTSLLEYQRTEGEGVVPSERKVSMEISYNKMGIFKNSYRMYGLIGVVLLIFSFALIFFPSKGFGKFSKYVKGFLVSLLVIVFLYHGYGIYMRWVISGHAPWSNGYEAVIFIAWISVLTGLIFSRKNGAILAGTAILGMLMIYVTEMNLMDPEITQLQPVLKSYWLMIHVAIITGSYGPLGISCILGLFNLLLYVFRNKRNGKMVSLNINELTYVSEMTMTIGLFMLTIGTFLGGIWANESWGRYWGWDSKETWALVSVLVYAVILHLRYIPTLKGKFIMSAFSFWGYASIIFTFFGVNFYLSGLHSYAQGESMAAVPAWVSWIILGAYVLTEIAYVQNERYKSPTSNVPISKFIKHSMILSAWALGVTLFGALFSLIGYGVAMTFAIKLIGIILCTNACLFVYSYLRTKFTAETTSEVNTSEE